MSRHNQQLSSHHAIIKSIRFIYHNEIANGQINQVYAILAIVQVHVEWTECTLDWKTDANRQNSGQITKLTSGVKHVDAPFQKSRRRRSQFSYKWQNSKCLQKDQEPIFIYNVQSCSHSTIFFSSNFTRKKKKIKIMKTSLWIGAFKLKINFVGREKGLDNHNLIS